jgi:hypothetical protein
MSAAKPRALSRRAMRNFDVDADLEGGSLPDRREKDIQALTVVDEGVFETLREVFDGTGLMGDQRKVKLLLKLRTDVSSAWNQTRDAFIEIGRALNDVDRELNDEERDRFKDGFRRLFPFSETVASQFRTIARAVDEGALSRDQVPGSYGTAYQMALLSREQLRIAQMRGLIRPDVTRDALIEFRRQIDSVQPRQASSLSPVRMRSELARLERSERKQAAILDALRARIAEIRKILAAD